MSKCPLARIESNEAKIPANKHMTSKKRPGIIRLGWFINFKKYPVTLPLIKKFENIFISDVVAKMTTEKITYAIKPQYELMKTCFKKFLFIMIYASS